MRILTFFSYKGGAGRTTLTYNIIPLLCSSEHLGASAKRPLVVVDLDIDSMGMTYLLRCNVKRGKTQNIDPCEGKPFVEDILKNGSVRRVEGETQLQSLKRALVPVGNKFLRDDEEILFLRARGGSNINDTGKSNYDADENSKRNLRRFVEFCEDAGCAGVIFDSAVGDQATAQYGNSIADTIVCCMRPTRQFSIGSEDFLHRTDNKYEKKNIILVPNVVPMEDMVIDGKSYPNTGKSALMDQFDVEWIENSKNEYIKTMMKGQNFGIPKVDRFMWKEDILNNIKNRTEQEDAALAGYEMLADVICEIEEEELSF